MKDLNITVTDGVKTIEVLQGEAQKRTEPTNVNVAGLISAPKQYLKQRKDFIEVEKCHLIVDKSAGSLKLVVDEKSKYVDAISGALKINPDFENFGINEGVQRDTFKLANFIKMNRFFFSDKNVAIKLVSELKNFKAKVNKQVEASENDRGNARFLLDQVVESNIPVGFDIDIAIFKGQPKKTFKVEININSQNFECTLISPDAKDLVNELKEKLINDELKVIESLLPGLVILEV